MLVAKNAVSVVIVWIYERHHLGKRPRFNLHHKSQVVTIEVAIFVQAMAVEVTKKEDSLVFFPGSEQLRDRINSGLQKLVWFLVVAVQIQPMGIKSEVASLYPIWIDHGNNFEHKLA